MNVARNIGGETSPVVYRCEHGRPDGRLFHCRRGSISFGTLEAAVLYATSPNSRLDLVHEPRVIAARLRIERPFPGDPDDQFLDLSLVERTLGRREALRIAIKFADAIENTNNWEEISHATGIRTVRALLTRRPGVVKDLYFDAYLYFDDAAEIASLRKAGFDGAVHSGSGGTHGEREYKVFDASRVAPITGWMTPERAREFAAAEAGLRSPAVAP